MAINGCLDQYIDVSYRHVYSCIHMLHKNWYHCSKYRGQKWGHRTLLLIISRENIRHLQVITNAQSNLESVAASSPFSSPMQLVICVESDRPWLFNNCRSWAVNRSSEVWLIMSIWFSKNISRFRSDSRILLKVVCTFAFACTTRRQYLELKPA